MTTTDIAVKLIMNIIPRMLHSFTASIRGPEVGLSPAHFRILHMLEHGSMSMSELAKKQFITKASLCDSVNLLVDKGWVAKTKDESDQRRVQLMLTPVGQAEIEVVKNQMHDVIAYKLKNASEDDLASLISGLQKIEELFLK